jgi:hypothetical protein
MGSNISKNIKKNTDLTPEQNVLESGNAQTPHESEQQAFLKSHVKLSEVSRKTMSISNAGTSNSTLVLFGNGNLTIKLISYPDIFLMAVYFENHISLRFNENTVKLFIQDKQFLLPNFMKLINQEISEGDFKKDLVREFQSDYLKIWSILTSGADFQAHYEFDSQKKIDVTDYLTEFDLFKHKSRIYRLKRNPFSGNLFAHVFGQIRPVITFEGLTWSLASVSFLNETDTTAAMIDFSFLKSCFVLHLDGKSYNLPKYVEVLSGTISQNEFKKRLYVENKDDFIKLWKFLVNRERRHLARYTPNYIDKS